MCHVAMIYCHNTSATPFLQTFVHVSSCPNRRVGQYIRPLDDSPKADPTSVHALAGGHARDPIHVCMYVCMYVCIYIYIER